MLRRAVFVLSMALLLILAAAIAQYKPRTVGGIVTDKRGNALPQVAVQLENTVTLTVVSYITGKDGRYHFTGLNEDIDFTLKAKYRNYWSKTKTLSKFDPSTDPEVDLVIPID